MFIAITAACRDINTFVTTLSGGEVQKLPEQCQLGDN
jgi:hypothetical protein